MSSDVNDARDTDISMMHGSTHGSGILLVYMSVKAQAGVERNKLVSVVYASGQQKINPSISANQVNVILEKILIYPHSNLQFVVCCCRCC